MVDTTRKVLFIDDDAETRNIFKRILSRFDVPGIEAASGSEALDILQERASEIALILMDLRMPEMNGLEAAASIRLNPQLDDIPIVLITAASDAGLIQEASEVGITQYIVKPITQKTIRTLLLEYHLLTQ